MSNIFASNAMKSTTDRIWANLSNKTRVLMSFDHTYFYVMSQILIVAIHNETHYIIIIKVTTTSQFNDRLIISHGNTMTIHAILNEDCELFVRIRTSLKEIRVSQS